MPTDAQLERWRAWSGRAAGAAMSFARDARRVQGRRNSLPQLSAAYLLLLGADIVPRVPDDSVPKYYPRKRLRARSMLRSCYLACVTFRFGVCVAIVVASGCCCCRADVLGPSPSAISPLLTRLLFCASMTFLGSKTTEIDLIAGFINSFPVCVCSRVHLMSQASATARRCRHQTVPDCFVQ